MIDSSKRVSPGLRLTSALTFDLPELDSRLTWDTSHFDDEGYLSIMSTGTSLLEGRPLNYPNPFKLDTGTEIGYWLNQDADIQLRIYTANGNEVFKTQLTAGIDAGAKAGYNKISINKAVIGMELSSGVYPYVLIHNQKVIATGKMVVRP